MIRRIKNRVKSLQEYQTVDKIEALAGWHTEVVDNEQNISCFATDGRVECTGPELCIGRKLKFCLVGVRQTVCKTTEKKRHRRS
jgi:hypothetical protein